MGCGLLCCTPLLRTKWWIDIFLLPAYAYACIAAFSPFYFEYYTKALTVNIHGDQHLFLALCILFALFSKAKIPTKTLETFLGWFGIINLLGTHFMYALSFTRWAPTAWGFPTNRLGSFFVLNTSLNMVLNICLLPYMCELGIWAEVYCVFSIIVLILFAASSSSWLGLVILWMAYLYKQAPPKRAWPLVFAGLALIALGYFFVGSFLNDGGRISGWKFFFDGFSWREYLIGRGPATFQFWGAVLQYANDFNMGIGYFIFLHSDPLQVIWEYGFVGLSLVSVAVYQVLQRAKLNEFLSLSVLLSVSLIYYPFHTPVHLFIIFILLKLVIDKDHSTGENAQYT